MKEHNFANYMFFLMHIINKPDTEHTGQVNLFRFSPQKYYDKFLNYFFHFLIIKIGNVCMANV
jgi:hypothetical protein